MPRPTCFDPVKAIIATRGSRTSTSPIALPEPGRKCSTSAGTPARQRISHIACAIPRVCVDGFTSAVLPTLRAAAVMPQQIDSGKFHGLMIEATPRGWYHW